MPKDLPKAIMALIWLLSGTIIFGWFLMDSTILNSFVFLGAYFGLPMLFVSFKKKQKS
jgi:uncharacterized MAPEG superfamily protein